MTLPLLDSAMGLMDHPVQRKNYFFIRSNNILHKVASKEIQWVNADGNYSYIFTQKQKFAVKISLKKLFEKLPPQQFLRIHKSYLINVSWIDLIDVGNSELQIAGKRIPMGRQYKMNLLDDTEIL